jgi:rRNA maturation protein Nop10
MLPASVFQYQASQSSTGLGFLFPASGIGIFIHSDTRLTGHSVQSGILAYKNIEGGERYTLYVCTACGGEGYTLQVCSAEVGQRYTLNVHTAYNEDG